MDRQLPEGLSLLVRTDFSDDDLWQEVLRSTGDEDQEEPYYPQFTIVDDRQFENLTIGELLDIVGPDRSYIFLADRQTMTDPEHPLLVVDTGSEEYELHTPGQSVRVTGPGIESIESNLSIANMDFVSFVESADSDGVFRGFEQPANPPQYQELPIGTFRDSVGRRLERPLFPELLHDLNTDNHGHTILVTLHIDMAHYRAEIRKPNTLKEWRDERKDEFIRTIDKYPESEAATVHLTLAGRYIWSIVLDPQTLEPIAAFRRVSTALLP
ncbi:hypothetical protein B2J88_49400 [Rhodococcus sp. SRB_17]|nr:hypothetical protein [Rhodococcus sp. SRB_17]